MNQQKQLINLEYKQIVITSAKLILLNFSTNFSKVDSFITLTGIGIIIDCFKDEKNSI